MTAESTDGRSDDLALAAVANDVAVAKIALQGNLETVSGSQLHVISIESLWEVVEKARARDISTRASSSSESRLFAERLDEKIRRAANYFGRNQKQQEKSAKALLFEICRSDKTPETFESLSYFRVQVEDIKNASLNLRHSIIEHKKALEVVSSCADEVMGTEFCTFLAQKMSVPPWNKTDSTLVVVLSDLYEAIRSIENPKQDEGVNKKWEAPSSFERSTTKYWVESDMLSELLYTCSQEVPLLVYGKSGQLTSTKDLEELEDDKLWKKLATKISSVYFDSSKMSLYAERIARKEGAQLFRVRWYGDKPKGDQKLFLELKTHREKWVNATSVKERVTVMERHMTAFLQRVQWSDEDARLIVTEANPKLKGDELDSAVDLLLRMHQLVVEKDLCPCVRSVYCRVAFQASDSNALRLTLDRDVTMIDESGAPAGAWCLPDTAHVADSMLRKVPYPVFEVKLAGSVMPVSLENLSSKGVIIEASKFSKFLTGAAAFNSRKITTLPYWADHPAFHAMLMPSQPPKSPGNKPLIWSGFPEDKTTKSADQLTDSTTKSSVRQRIQNIYLKCRFPKVFSPRDNKKPNIAPKRPARVEPKSYFANERTFIQWASAALWLLTVAALITERGLNGAAYLTKTVIALCIGSFGLVIHAIIVYFRRIKLMETGNPNGYVDKLGPIGLTAVILIGILVLTVEDIKIASNQRNTASNTNAFLRVEQGSCFLHPLKGLSALSYEPSDIVMDQRVDMLLTVSLTQVVGHSTNDFVDVRPLVEIPGADLEGLTLAGDRIFALSEGVDAMSPVMLYELAWQVGVLQVIQEFTLGTGGNQAEAITYIPGNDSDGDKGSLCIDRGRADYLEMFELPPVRLEDDDSKQGTTLVRRGMLNRTMITKGLLDGKIASIFYFEGVLYILHDNDKVLRSWDLSTGDMISEMPLPKVEGEASLEWEGFAIERNLGSYKSLRGNNNSLTGSSSSLTVHLSLDTPPQVWSISVKEGEKKGELIFPECAGFT